MEEKVKCPVCGKYEFEEYNDFDYCEVCGWQNDAFQEKYPDRMGGANPMSLNQMREGYKMGKNRDQIREEARAILKARLTAYENQREEDLKHDGTE